MKRAVALLLTLTLLGAAGIVCADRAVGASAEAVEMRETVLSGDRAAAEGVEVFFPEKCDGHLFWNTTLSVGAEDMAAKSDFRFSRKWKHVGRISWPDTVLTLGVSDIIMGESTNEGHELYTLISDVASRAVSGGGEYSESVRLRDYYEYMPLYVSVGQIWLSDEQRVDEEAFERQLRELFEIPVPEDYYLNVSVERDTGGGLVYWSVYPRDERVMQLDYETESTTQGCWFAAHLSYEGGEAVCAGADKLWFRPAESASGEYAGRAGELIHVMDIAPDEQVQRLETDAVGRLLMLTKKGGAYYLRIIDGADGDGAQMLELTGFGADECVNWLHTGENFVIAESSEDRFTLYELTDGGEYVPCLSGEFPLYDDGYVFSLGEPMLWDGQRLVAVRTVYDPWPNEGQMLHGFMLLVYDETGLALCAVYDSSLCMSRPGDEVQGVESTSGPELSLS